MSELIALPPEGWSARWEHWDGGHAEALTITWENEAWTVLGEVAAPPSGVAPAAPPDGDPSSPAAHAGVTYVLRLSPRWVVRQFLLFRDLDDPDLWLATDTDGRWGEMNGVYRPELDRARDIHLPCTPFTATLPLRRFAGDDHDAGLDLLAAPTIEIDVETLAAVPVTATLTRLGERRWERRVDGDPATAEVITVDEHGFAIDVDGRFRRTA